MKQYRLLFRPLSTISRIPDAQTVFGAICQILLQTQGQDALDTYLSSFEKEPILLHSSMFPDHMLPMVCQNPFSAAYITNSLMKQESKQQLKYLQETKQFKKILYVSEKVFREYFLIEELDEKKVLEALLNKKLVIKNGCLMHKEETLTFALERELTTHVQKSSYYMNAEKANDLYYDPVIYCGRDTRFQMYIKTSLSEKELKRIFSYTQYFGFGPRHSSGKNSFALIPNSVELMDIKDIHKTSSERCILLSKSAFDETFVLDTSYYQIVTRHQRTSNYYAQPVNGYLQLFKEGSAMKVSSMKEWYGQLFCLQEQEHPVYVYAVGYVM